MQTPLTPGGGNAPGTMPYPSWAPPGVYIWSAPMNLWIPAPGYGASQAPGFGQTAPTPQNIKSGAGIYYLLPSELLHKLWMLREKYLHNVHKWLHPFI